MRFNLFMLTADKQQIYFYSKKRLFISASRYCLPLFGVKNL